MDIMVIMVRENDGRPGVPAPVLVLVGGAPESDTEAVRETD